MPRPARVSPDRILVAAAAEFAARGFAGARVDRIAAQARVNKAMLYYHFGSKRTLYRVLLRQKFSAVAAAIAAIAATDRTALDKLDAVVATLADHIVEQPTLPNIMLREVADGGIHLDRETLAALTSVPRAFAAIIQQGIAEHDFREVHPLFAYFTMIAPLVVFFGGAPIRRELAHLQLMDRQQLSASRFVAHLQAVMRRALGHEKH